MTSNFIKKQLKSKLGDLFCLYPFNLRLEITILDKFRGGLYDFKHTTFNIHYNPHFVKYRTSVFSSLFAESKLLGN